MDRRFNPLLITFLLFGLTSLAFAADKHAPSKEIAWSKLQGLGDIEYFQLKNTKPNKTKHPYHIFVRLPDEYNQSEKVYYPTLYLLDGGTNFPLFAAYYSYLRAMEDVPALIIVGISYGNNDWRKGNDRSHDFTVTTIEREFWGGAQIFEQFLSDRLMPSIQEKYRVDSHKQVLFGQSLGGQFALYTSMYGDAPFFAVIASNPALHRNLDYFKQGMKKRDMRPKVYVSIAEFDDPTYKEPTLNWVEYWQKQNVEWEYNFDNLKGHNHLSASPVALRNGLKWIFNK
ncbi:alpha/beta hydrolase [Aliiglaciecola litoralis]|uniref:alpha/beta hydrolase n=1 Tax=Aliiglaciecola litoralis TaxID=582857 RepID=UPI0031D7AB6F